MRDDNKRIRVLYSFPHKIGAERICKTAWHQVDGVLRAGVGIELMLHPGVVHRPFPLPLEIHPTLSIGKVRIPYRAIGTIRACALHDLVVSRRIEHMVGKVEAIHAWPLGALRTFRVAKKLGIQTLLERPNAHTRYAYEVVREECDRMGISLPKGHEHAFNDTVLRIEEQEYLLADHLLCPSDFVARTFLAKGFKQEKLLRHSYGFDEKVYYPGNMKRLSRSSGLKMLFVGVCAVRKGLHFALEAWLRSSASRGGVFLIAGEFVSEYAKKLAPMLRDPSIVVLGHRADVPDLMRESDIVVLPTIEEGFPLVCAEALGSGCVPLVSEVCAGICRHMKNSLVHAVGDVDTLTQHIQMLHDDQQLLSNLRREALVTSAEYTWEAAGRRLAELYRGVCQERYKPVDLQLQSSS